MKLSPSEPPWSKTLGLFRKGHQNRSGLRNPARYRNNSLPTFVNEVKVRKSTMRNTKSPKMLPKGRRIIGPARAHHARVATPQGDGESRHQRRKGDALTDGRRGGADVRKMP